jgi:DNA-binding GntR family transcriptional regulator
VAFVPDYQRVAADIRQSIKDGRLKPGDKLPTRRELIAQYGVSGQVIDSAMLVLKAEGWVRGHQGRGTYVADPLPRQA